MFVSAIRVKGDDSSSFEASRVRLKTALRFFALSTRNYPRTGACFSRARSCR